MQPKLTFQEKLKDERTGRHMTLLDLEKATGIAKSTLGKYESDNCTDISPFNLARLAAFYGLSMDYLMGLTENKNHPNTSLYELHLNDSTIDLLKSGALNNRLLCELICHPAFPRLLTDIEICVDRIADMGIHDMGTLLEAARAKIIEQAPPESTDLHLRTLELAKVSEDMFFSHVLQADLDEIVRDIRTRHKNDCMTADPETDSGTAISKNYILQLADALSFKGTVDEQRALVICNSLGINYKKLPAEDQQTLARIFKTSGLFKTNRKQRGKTRKKSLHDKKKRIEF